MVTSVNPNMYVYSGCYVYRTPQPNAKAAYYFKRVMGIEPTLSAWKAEVLPLNYTRICKKKE